MNRHYYLAIVATSCFVSWELFSSPACQSALSVADWLMGALGLLGIIVLARQAIWKWPAPYRGFVFQLRQILAPRPGLGPAHRSRFLPDQRILHYACRILQSKRGRILGAEQGWEKGRSKSLWAL